MFEEELRKFVPEEAQEFVVFVVDELVRRGFGKEEVWNKMKEIASSDYVRRCYNDKVALWTYAAEATKAVIRRQSGGEATKIEAVIPIGVTPLRTTKQGKRASIFALIKDVDRWKLDEIVFRGSLALTVDGIELYKVYNDVIVTSKGYFYEANVNTKFNSYTTELNEMDVLKKFRKVKMNEMKNALSRIDDRGFVDRTDLRVFEGFVIGNPRKKIDDERHIAVYDVTDDTLEESDISPDGTIVKPVMSVWCHPRFARWGDASRLLFVGTLEKRRNDGVVQMNAIYVKPIVVVSEVE